MIDDKFDFNQVDIVRGTARKTDTQIHTRVMVEDTSAPGYHIDTAEIIDAIYVQAFDPDVFQQKLLATYPDYASNQYFVEQIDKKEDQDNGKVALEITAHSSSTYMKRTITGYYTPDDPDFIALAAEWGITFGLGYGQIVYYIDSERTQTKTMQIQTQEELYSLSPGESATTAWVARIGEQNIPNQYIYQVGLSSKATTIPKNFLYGCRSLQSASLSGSSLTKVPDNFCRDSSARQIRLPSSTFQIGDNFAYGCDELTSVSNTAYATAIGTNFMYGCLNFNRSLSFTNLSYTSPSESKNDFTGWLHNAHLMQGTLTFTALQNAATWVSSDTAFSTVNSSQPIYTTGITIKGPARTAIRNNYPNLNGPAQYRKTIDGGS